MAQNKQVMRGHLLDEVRRRGLAHGDRSLWGQPVWRAIAAGQEPQALMDATTQQRRLLECAHGTPSPGDDQCAGWVEAVFGRLGICNVSGNARELCQSYCNRDRTSDLKVGMIIAVGAAPWSAQAQAHGHVGLYAGDAQVMDAVAAGIRTIDLELWMSTYGLIEQPRWGWLGSIDLSRM